MPHLRDLLKKRDKISQQAHADVAEGRQQDLPIPTFIRSTTESVEVITPPTYPDNGPPVERGKQGSRPKLGFRNSSNASFTKDPTAAGSLSAAEPPAPQQLGVHNGRERRLSERLHLTRRDRSRSTSAEASSFVPEGLPTAPEAIAPASTNPLSSNVDEEKEATDQREAQWEKRATILAMHNPLRDGQLHTEPSSDAARARGTSDDDTRPRISDAKGDVNIQEAIRLHEAGDLPRSTEMFGQLSDPRGANNALAQVLYGLALRHGWGVPVEPEKAIHYLSLAASNSASVEQQALASGLRKGGAAKGELVLAMFELGNCFRHGWGVKKDPVAARQYYDTAANLGDTDAMEEAAWCYMEGFGGGKDKFKAAQYLRLAEQKGGKAVGNSWIWKDKYNPK